MAEQQQPKYFEIEDYETGKKYRVEAYADDVTYDEAVEHLSSLPEEEWAQYEYNPEGATTEPAAAPVAAPATAPAEAAADPVEVEAPQEPRRNVWIENMTGGTTRYTEAFRNRQDLVDKAETMWASGERDPAKYNEILGTSVFTKEGIASIRAREAWLKAEGYNPQGNLFTSIEPTGIPEPEAPDTVTGSLLQSSKKAILQTGNAVYGLAGLGADLVGADETAEALLEKYVEREAAVNYYNPDAVGSLENVKLDNFAQYGAEAVGAILPDIATGGVFAFGGRQVAKAATGRAVANFIEDQVQAGVPRQIAENIAAQTAAKYARRGAVAGVTGQSIAQETGRTYGDTFLKTGERAPLSSIAAGVLSGSLDAVIPVRFLDNMGIGGDIVRQAFGKSLGKALTEGAKGFAIEGATEAMQTFIAELPTSYITGESPFTEEMLMQMADAFVKGGIGGGTLQAASAAATGDYRGPQAIVTPEREATIVAPEGRRNSKKYKQALTDATARGQEITDEIVGGWENKPNVRVVENFQNERFDNDALGVYEGDGNIALNMEAIVKEAKTRNVSPDTVVESVLFHEALGHYGLESLYRDNLDAKLTEFYERGSEDFVRMVDSWIEQNPGAYVESNGEVNIARAAEEVLAEMSEAGNIPRSMIDELLNMIKNFMRNMGLDNTKLFRDSLKFSERELRTIVAIGQSKVRDGEQVDLNTGTPSDKYMYIGSQGLVSNIAMDRPSKEVSKSLLDDLDVTRELFQDQMDAAATPEEKARVLGQFRWDGESRGVTGWFIGPDKKWRMEISDDQADIFTLPEPGNSYRLDDVLIHPELFNLYPRLTEMRITMGDDSFKSLGQFDEENLEITLNKKYYEDYVSGDPKAAQEVLTTIIHEVQHAIQGIEDFGRGGSPASAFRRLPSAQFYRGVRNLVNSMKAGDLKRLNVFKDTSEWVRESDEYKAYQESLNEQRKLWDELEQARALDNPNANAIRDEWNKVYNRTANLRNEVNAMLGMPKYVIAGEQGITQQEVNDYFELMRYVEDPVSLETKIAQVKEDIEVLENDLATRTKDTRKRSERVINRDPKASFQAYEALFGEVEARDTQERISMSAEERRKIAPYTVEGKYEPEDFAVAFDYKRAAREEETTSAGFRRTRMDDRSRAEARKQFWKSKTNPDWNPDDPNGLPSEPKYAKPRVARIEEARGPSFNADGKTVKQLIAYDEEDNVLAVARQRRFENRQQWEERLIEDAERGPLFNPPKYARPMRQNKKVEPLTIDELTAEDLFNSLNAYDIVKRVSDNYLPTALSLDDLQNEALLRDVPVSAVQKLSVNPGDFTVKLFQYDMVARKLNDKVATLAEKINSGKYTAKDKSDFLKASFAFEDVTAKIFGLQSEYGRALRALQEMEFTSKKVRTIRDALKGLTGEAAGLEGMDDPATFEKFARSMAKRIQLKTTPSESSLGDKFASAINTPRAIMSSFDLSAPLRQGIFFIGRKEYYKAWGSMFSGVMAEKNYTDMMKDVMKSEYYPLMSVGKLFISSLDGDLSSREESFQSNFAQNVPGVRRSEVAYAAFLNKLRTDLFKSYIDTFEQSGYEFVTKVDPQTGQRVPKPADELSEKEVAILKGLGSFINAGTGRGNLTIGDKTNRYSRLIQSAGPLLNALLFSPGLIASRIRLLNPAWYATLPAPVRKQAIMEAGKFFSGAAMTLGLITMAAAAMGDDEVVEWDPRSSNFLKVNVNGTRYDIMGGMAQYMTLFTKGLVHTSNLLFDTEIAAKKTSTGGLARYEDDFRGRTYADDIIRFGRYKTSPMMSLLWDFADGKNAVGEPFTVAGAVASRMMPLYMQDLLDIAEEDGANAASFASVIPGFFGVGVSRYTPQPLDTEQELVAPDSWQDETFVDEEGNFIEDENNFVIIREGRVILKDPAVRMYEKTVNAFFRELMAEQTAMPDWPDLSPKEQAEIIEDAKRIARNETKKYISPLIGIEDAPVEEEFVE